MNRQITILKLWIISTALLAACGSQTNVTTEEASSFETLSKWETAFDRSVLLEKMETKTQGEILGQEIPVIAIDEKEVYQEMDGFGFTLNGGSAMLIRTKLSEDRQNNLLEELFSRKEEAIGINFLRVSIGASDLDELVYSYADTRGNETDAELKSFSLAYDTLYLIPVLQKILEINPEMKIMGSPWSPPAWMKTNQSPIGGKLKSEFYGSYAEYFVKYVKAMEENGIPIYAVTLQNEPEHPGNNPSMLMEATEQAEFIKSHLGPAFQRAGISTKIIIYDHNCDHPGYPIAVLNDKEAYPFIDGSAFHLYLGEIDAMSEVKKAHPEKNIYFTEQWTSSKGDFGGDLQWHIRNLIIGASRNWAKTVLEWNLAADPEQRPFTPDGGCSMCLGALTISDESVERNVAYYIIAHASKFVPSGSKRIGSTDLIQLPNVAFLTPENRKVLVVLNEQTEAQPLEIQFSGEKTTTQISAKSVATFVW
ncbi:MAG TPA: glycoside hydrolase family 30 beta sandwich domain-containing protein [Cyclobacteriaceae bacterium]|nr:glycoside hydrolase family 30 beta sandwich domain-containing protein [Cyclobacteriaceae bacterium]